MMIHRATAVLLLFLSCQYAMASDLTLMLYQQDAQTILSWSSDQDRIVRQEVYRKSTLSDEGERIAVLTPDERTFEDTTADGYTDYYYQIKAVDDQDHTFISNDTSTNASEENYLTTSLVTASSSECYAGAVIKNKTVDCQGKTIGLNCNGDAEGQKAVLTLHNATVKNVRISRNGGADGIHCQSGNCTLQNVIWEDICEDAATNNGKKMTIIGGVAYNSKNGPGGKPDKVFQHNSKNSTTEILGNFTLTGEHGKLYRSCGNCTNNGGPRYLSINGVKVDAKIGSIAGINGNYRDTATIRNLKIKNYKTGKPKVCVEYVGIQKGQGESKKIGEKWNTSACNVSQSDVRKL
ncbi:Pectate lyase A precursor [Vibrio ruber DSM 16370]|uniref:Pectate lyase n=1 Tax=Vibrio ruber (strain DSM 16370 / JCM 11486 / BCRC 17186 / CECT 7878 / LMG 23124 / VR1) TaxID=1123498 RepID=A0A1R4LGW6_VIBR1|nr:pectate lyase [Vibrio ruber]SJN55703.1 Pectate lyase A precursor [Vibrio ruber DSM 16370]